VPRHLEDRFAQLLRGLVFPKEIPEWIVKALRESHTGEAALHDEAISRLQAEYRRLQSRIDAMFLNKLDGRIDTGFFDDKSPEWRGEQDRLLRDLATHRAANRTCIEQGVQLLQLAHRAHQLFERQEAGETATPEFSALELRLEGRRPHRGISPTS
jgi:site-specific DNA recombinase